MNEMKFWTKAKKRSNVPNVIVLEKFKVGKSTLAEMHSEITEGIFPFICLIVTQDNALVSCITIPWARFRDVDEQPTILELRSNDVTDNSIPTHMAYLSKEIMKNYIFKSHEGTHYYSFEYHC
jgi:hypothetical protein